MKYHMKYIIPDRVPVPKEMVLHLSDSHLQSKILLFRDRKEYILQIRNILLQNNNCKGFPIQNLVKWWHKVVRYYNRNTFVENGFHYSWTVHFIAFGTNAVLAALHVLNIVPVAL
ncbi:hypothetical protein V8G54_035924 [Vigna mungo]|uniref:Uncharacterized protein n=1 Tax=Vigna mungo TaxID=3915 RepID=A0AAQ3MGD4_VIGMU